jgi:hypothetical protein
MPALGLGIGIPFRRMGAGLSPEAKAWEARIIANGGTIPAATLAIFDEYFFIPAKANGNILTELDRLNIYCGLNGYEIAARTNTIKSAHFVTPVSSPIFDNNGYKSGGTSYLDLNYNPSTQGVKFTLNSACIGYVVRNPLWTAQKRAIGNHTGVADRTDLQRDTSSSGVFVNSQFGVQNTNKPSGKVFLMALRTASNADAAITNATIVNGSNASTAIPNNNIYELGLNFGGLAIGPFDTNEHLCSFNGSGSLDYANLRTILNNLFTALGV